MKPIPGVLTKRDDKPLPEKQAKAAAPQRELMMRQKKRLRR